MDRTVVAGSGLEIGITPDGTCRPTLTGAQRRTIRRLRGTSSPTALLDGRTRRRGDDRPAEVSPSPARLVLPLDGEPEWEIDGKADAPTTSGGAWALGAGPDARRQRPADGAYCLADGRPGRRRPRGALVRARVDGFADARPPRAGTSLLTFDDGRPVLPHPRLARRSRPRTRSPAGRVRRLGRGLAAAADPAGGGSPGPTCPTRTTSAPAFSRTDGTTTSTVGSGPPAAWSGVRRAAYVSARPAGRRALLGCCAGNPAPPRPWPTSRPPDGQTFISAPRCGGDQLTVIRLVDRGRPAAVRRATLRARRRLA